MTPTTEEVLDHFQIRKSKKQKRAFIDWLRPVVERSGYTMNVERSRFWGTSNIVIGDIETAKVVYTAHYDTCAVLPIPNFITPKSLLIYILYQFAILIPMFAIVFGATFVASWLSGELAMWAYYLSLGLILFLLMFGPANRHTANDNTSGVTAIIDLMNSMPEALKQDAAFVLFDLEEAGLIGSSVFASKHKKAMKDKLLVNLDCVSDGTTVLFVFRKKSKAYVDQFRRAFPSDHRLEADFAVKGYVYPSDQANFPCGVGVATLNKTKRGLLYMDKIHTPKDTVYREENIQYLVEGCIRLTESLK